MLNSGGCFILVIEMGLDEAISDSLNSSGGMTFREIEKTLNIEGLNPRKLNNSLKRLCRYGDIRKVLYYDFSGKPKVFYVPFESGTFYVPT